MEPLKFDLCPTILSKRCLDTSFKQVFKLTFAIVDRCTLSRKESLAKTKRFMFIEDTATFNKKSLIGKGATELGEDTIQTLMPRLFKSISIELRVTGATGQ